MLISVNIAGLGPCRASARPLDPRGWTEITEPSEAGKSTLIDGVCWALWGVDAFGRRIGDERINDGDEAVVVTLRTAKNEFRRERKRGRPESRPSKNGEVAPNQMAWATALGPALGGQADLCRLILAPLAWTVLAQKEQGRPLRDLLAQVADLGADAVREVVAADPALVEAGGLRERDSVSEREAYDRRAEANRRRDELAGKVEAARERVERAAQPHVGARPDVAAAQSVLDLHEAWTAYDRGAVARDWDERRARLGERPEPDEGLEKKRAAKDEALRLYEAAWAEHSRALAKKSAAASPERLDAEAELRAAKAVGVPRAEGTCDACGQAVTAEHAHARAAQVARAVAEAQARVDAAVAAETRAKAEQAEQLRKLKAAADTAQQVSNNLNAVYGEALAKSATAAWDAGIRLLGERPQVEPAPEPGQPRPTPSQVTDARAALALAARSEGAAARLEAERAAATRDLDAVTAQHGAAVAEAARLDALVAAVRRAPSILAQRQRQALGDLGPVDVRFPSEGPAVEVLIDGRPWWTASRGRQVVADLSLRAGLRRALGVPWLPIFVDNAQDWSGSWPSVEGPVVLLRTAAAKAARVAA